MGAVSAPSRRPAALAAVLAGGLLAVGVAAFSAGGLPPDDAAGGTLPATAAPVAPTTVGPDGAAAGDPATGEATAVSELTSTSAATMPPLQFTGDFADFDRELTDGLIGSGALAVSVAVARDGELVHSSAFGLANPGTGELATPAHRFRIASISKVLTSIVALQLVEDGALELDEPVLHHITERLGVTAYGEAALASITLRHLLAHTSGFPEYEATFFGGRAPTCPDAARTGLTGRLTGTPGSNFGYSNMNFCVLGLVIEEVTGLPYEQVVQQRLLTPLGITDMRMAGTEDVRPGDIAHPTTPGRVYMEALGAAGAWIATAEDLVKILDALDPSRPGWHPLPKSVVAQMHAPGSAAFAGADRWYGLGLRVWADGTWGHTGTVENARSMVLRRPDGLTWAILVSGAAPSSSDRLRVHVDQALATLGISPPVASSPATTAPPVSTVPASTAA
jgi:D-alanyl-D-alanine carboxypeptidase